MEVIYNELKELIKNSCSKYYHYPVASILECKDGSKFYGVNVETSSPQAGICAERNAIFSALASGKTSKDYSRIYILNETDQIITPCFICRQALSDYCLADLEIISFNKSGQYKSFILGDLCPNGFGEDNLK